MSAVYPDNVLVEFYNGSAWIDISAYVVGDITGQRGLGGWQPTQRVAMLGTLVLTLNNEGKLFSPMGGDAARGLNTLTGFTRGAKIRVRIFYRGGYYTRWIGRILTIDSDDKNWGLQHTRVYAVDWMDVPANFPMKKADISLNQTMDQALALILARLSIQPDDTDIDVGAYEFQAVFDNVKNQTMAIGEFNKLAMSELGYIYVKGDGTLRAESSEARFPWRPLDTVNVDPASIGYLLKEDGGYLLKEDGGKIVLDESVATAVALYQDAEGYNILLDRDALLNSVTVRAYPTIVDTSLKVLFNMGKPRWIGVANTVTFSGHYTDPNSLLQVAGTNMQTPVATTDYLANTLEDGTGTDKTADVAVTATYYGDTVEYSIKNNSTVDVWITMLKARGYGIYYGQSIEYHLDDAVSQAAYGFAGVTFNMSYQRTTEAGEHLARKLIDEYKDPESRISKLNYLANLNMNHMASFLNLDIGSLIRVTEDRSNIDAHYYITDIGFSIKQGGIVNVSYGLQQNDTLLSGGRTSIAIENNTNDEGGVNFGLQPVLSNLPLMSISFWAYIYARRTTLNPILAKRTVIGGAGNNWGYLISAYTSGQAIDFWRYYSNTYRWSTDQATMPINQWVHVVITQNWTKIPAMYINGAPMEVFPLLISGDPGEVPKDDAKASLHLTGEIFATTSNEMNGKMFDVRYYDRILSDAEVSVLYNGGDPDPSLVTDGLIFQAFAVRTARLGDYIDQTLTAQTTVRDNIFGEIGTPVRTTTGRAGP